ncbi:HD-GYP domain-containing protein [Thalassotalea piscium]|uniref:Putative nucleotidyltransferase with HDIG domain n=1 Tax=Thalassotalea piscium TaxID=1230533 RepID=A0A7X0NGG8_9GAMM|nr:HD-GYP domain-containing protein [Thalassotalea piscium]MBB6543027.1 putative nucleotidyltransferase with HDIG domain [Thalassotalea piscium]
MPEDIHPDKIPLAELTLGMYVTSVFDRNNKEIKSEGYISTPKGLEQLNNAKIKFVTVAPEKQKHVDTIDRVFPDIEVIKPNSSAKQKPTSYKITLYDEINKANDLYDSSKALQAKILDKIQQGKSIKIDEVETTTDSIVDSIFRNQDALSCLSRLQTKGSYLLEHSLNVAILMAIFSKQLGFDKRVIQEVTLGAFLHDIGKVLLPKEILNKPEQLNDKEYKIWKSHVALGIKVLEDSPSISHIAARMIKEHHERLDGSGFPSGLQKQEISIFGRMMAIVDTYDSMTCDRPYRKSVHPVTAFKALVTQSPLLFDEELVEKFIQCIGVYPVGTLVKLNSGKLGLISKLNPNRPLRPFVKVFYNTRLSQAIPIQEINLSESKYKDQIDCCIKPEEFNINLLGFFKAAFLN